ncbi:MAG: tetratricopeptide repeat protein [Bacteroidales bacterium]|nr:tetratricopeptide repeat protein [Bacteroidales bacterium]
MKRKSLLAAAVMATAISAGAQINSPVNAGYLARGEAMFADRNYAGCIDQLSSLDRSALTAVQLEQADWLLAVAAMHTSGAAAVGHLQAFIANYPASLHRGRALMYIGDCLVESDPAAALKAYEAVDPAVLDAADRAAWRYHRAYCRLMTGDLDAAAAGFAAAAADSRWRNNADFYLGYIAYTRREYDVARRCLQSVDRHTSPGIDADYYLAQIEYVEGDYKQALSYAEQLLARQGATDEYRAEACRIAGESAHQLGDTGKAVEYLRQYASMVEDPAPSALYLLGTAEYARGRYADAVRSLEPVTACDDAMGQSASLFIGEAQMRLGDKDAAVLAFDRARRLDYDKGVQEAALYNYAVARFGGANVPFGSSVAAFEEFLAKFPDGRYAPAVQEYLVAGYLADNNYETALASIERMRRPGDKVLAAKQQILYALGTRALATGDAGTAAAYLERSRELGRHNPAVAAQTALSLGEARYRLGDNRSAVTYINEYLRNAPADDRNRKLARYDLGYACFGLKDYAKALPCFVDAAESHGALPEAVEADALNRAADTYYYTGDWAKADTYYGRAYDRNPGSGDYPAFQRAVMQGYQRDHKGKIASMRRMIAEFPTSSLIPDALLEMTESYQQLGDTRSALDTYDRIIADYPATTQARRATVQMAMTRLNTGDRAGAVAAYRRLISESPTSDEARVAAEELKRLAAEDGTLGEFGAFLASVDNAPQLDVAEADALAFDAAERAWVTGGRTDRLKSYLADYPSGAYRPAAYACLMDAAASPAEALEYASAIVERYPDSRHVEAALTVKAESLYSLGRGDEALAAWQALEQRASTPQALNAARTGIMRVARDMADASLMLGASDALLASSTTGSEVRNEATFTRGLALSLDGKGAEARDMWRRIAGETDDLYGVKSAYYLAESLYDSRDYDGAREAVEAVIDSATPHTYWLARAFILLSDIYAAQGKTYEAREYLRSLRDNYPGNETDIMQMIDSRLNKK